MFRGLSRRVRTLIVAGVLFVVLFVLALTMPVPYVVLSPGPTVNTLGSYQGTAVITIGGRSVNHTSGHLNLTTVDVTTRPITALEAVMGWLEHDEVVVPRSAVYPPGQSEAQTDHQNHAEFVGAQDSATAAALCELGYPKGFGVVDVLPDGASAGILHPGDRFRTVDGKAATSATELTSILGAITPGTTVPVVVDRQNSVVTEKVTTGKPDAGRHGSSLGVEVTTGCLAPFTVDLGLANVIGGPSAGLMFALGIMDKVGSLDLTDGTFVAGTGTITSAGTVGPIGGIALKMIAARDAGATVFLAPAGNCTNVRGAIPSGLDVVKVSSLSGAVTDLTRLQHHQSVPHC